MRVQPNNRIVLPHSSTLQQRRVILPRDIESNTNVAQTAPARQADDMVSTTSGRVACEPKPGLSAKEYKEYLEDMELKIRYMKNDIEFKQSLLDKKPAGGTSASQTKTFVVGKSQSQPVECYNSSVSHMGKVPRSVSVCYPSSNSFTSGYTGTYPKDSRRIQLGKTVYVAGPSHPKGAINSVNNSAQSHTFFNRSSVPSYQNRRFNSSAFTYVNKNPSACSSTTSSAAASLSGSKFVPTTCNTTLQASFVSTANRSSCTFGLARDFPANMSYQPIYASACKNQTTLTESPVRNVLCHSTKDLKTQHKVAASIREVEQTKPDLKTENVTSGSIASVSMSRYKLVKSTPSLQNISQDSSSHSSPSGTASIKPVPSSSTESSNTTKGTTPNSRPSHNSIPKLKISAKKVSKYKLTRLSPNSTSKIALKFCQGVESKSSVQGSGNSQYGNIHKLDRRLCSNSLSTQHKHISKKNQKTPKLKLVMAAKLVSKYKLKRISPTSVPKYPPTFLQGLGVPSTSSGTIPTCRNQFQNHTVQKTPLIARDKTNQGFNKKNVLVQSGQRKMKLQNHVKDTSKTSRFKLDRRTLSAKKTSSKLTRAGPFTLRRSNTNEYRLNTRTPTTSYNKRRMNLTTRLHPYFTRRKLQWRDQMRIFCSPAQASTHLTAARKERTPRSKYRWRRSSGGSDSGKLQSISHKTGPMYWGARNLWMGSTLYPRTNLVMIKGVVYRSASYNNPARDVKRNHAASNKSNRKLITVRGAHFCTDSTGKRLFRKEQATEAKAKDKKTVVDETTILAASRVVQRSIAVATAKHRKSVNTGWKKNKQHCIFYGRFGKCHRGDACQFVHDPEKVAVCTRFLRGKCELPSCSFSHNASVHKMPVCLHFLQGMCTRVHICPYLHVRVNKDAPACRDFLNGYCSLGDKCKKLHSFVCPAFALTGECNRRSPCTLLHRKIKRETVKGNASTRGRKRCKSSGSDTKEIKKKRAKTNHSENLGPVAATETDLSLLNQHPDEANIEFLQTCQEASDDIQLQKPLTAYTEQSTKTVRSSVTTSVVPNTGQGAVPLSSQPSFISLLDCSPQQLLPSPKASLGSETNQRSQPAPRIKPLFLTESTTQPRGPT